jgi:hypothetical protein
MERCDAALEGGGCEMRRLNVHFSVGRSKLQASKSVVGASST